MPHISKWAPFAFLASMMPPQFVAAFFDARNARSGTGTNEREMARQSEKSRAAICDAADDEFRVGDD